MWMVTSPIRLSDACVELNHIGTGMKTPAYPLPDHLLEEYEALMSLIMAIAVNTALAGAATPEEALRAAAAEVDEILSEYWAVFGGRPARRPHHGTPHPYPQNQPTPTPKLRRRKALV